jgi:hypothetical protein
MTIDNTTIFFTDAVSTLTNLDQIFLIILAMIICGTFILGLMRTCDMWFFRNERAYHDPVYTPYL